VTVARMAGRLHGKANAHVAAGVRDEGVLDLRVTPYAGTNRVRFEGCDLSLPEQAPLSSA